ncbi:MAG: hypothetical protein K2M46_04200 [Lachnospiraceae bacterium]|nr:hypothetical protein [Lachnospiraceae bacterium]
MATKNWTKLFPTKASIAGQLKDVNTSVPTINPNDCNGWIQQLNQIDQRVQAGYTTWQEYSDGLNDNQKWIARWGQQTQGQIRNQEQMIQANKEARESIISQNAALKQTTISGKAASAAYKSLSIAANMIAFALIAKGIQLASHAIDQYINRAKYAAEAMEEAQQKINDSQSTLRTMSATIAENKDRFLELSQGVDEFSNNLHLSEKDYAEYLSISQQLAELCPSLVNGYDEQGNALLSIGNSADETNQKLQELLETQKTVAQQTLIDNMDDVATGIFFEVGNTKDSINELQTELDNLQGQYKESNIDIAGSHGLILFDDDDFLKYGELLQDALTSAGIEYEKNTSSSLYQTGIQLISASPEQLKNAQQFYDAQLEIENEYLHAAENGLKKDIKAKEQSLNDSYAKMTANLQAWAKDNYNYQYLSDEASGLVDVLIPKIKWSEMEDAPTTSFDYQNYIEKNIIDPLMAIPIDKKSGIDAKIKELLAFEPGDLNILPFAQQLQAELDQLGIKIDITPITAEEQEAKDSLTSSIKSIAGKSSTDYKRLQEHTKGFNVEQIDMWNNVTLGAKSAEMAIHNYEEAKNKAGKDILSFEFLFNSPDFADSKEKLLELAKSGEITAAVLSSTEEYNSLLSKTGLSAQEAKAKILDMLTPTEKLTAASSGLSNLAKAYDEFNNKGFATTSVLDTLPDAFKELDGYDLFRQIVGDPTSGTEKIQQAFDDIARQYLISQQTLKGITEENKGMYIANLKESGVVNAQAFAEEYLANSQMIDDIEQNYLNYVADKGEIDSQYLQQLTETSGNIPKLLGSVYQTDYENWCDLINQKAQAYNEFVEALGGSYNPALSVTGNMAANGANMGASSIADAHAAASLYFQAVNAAEQQTEQLKLNISPIRTNFGKTSISSSGGSGKDSSAPTPETFDFIETKLSSLQKAFDRLKEKAENTWYSFTKRAVSYGDTLSKVTEEIEAQQKAYAAYMGRANAVKLPESWAVQVRDGSFNIVDVTDDNLKEQIRDYQNWYEKAKACQEKIEELKKTQTELTQAKIETLITEYEKLADAASTKVDYRESWIDLKETWGGFASSSDYANMSKNMQTQMDNITKSNTELEHLKKTVDKGSEAWYEYDERCKKNLSTLRDLKKQMAENAAAAAKLAAAKAEAKIDNYDSKDELYDAKIDNAISAKGKNNLINKKIRNINNRQKAYDQAATTSTKKFNSAKTALNKYKSTSDNKSVLNSIKKYAKAGKRIPSSILAKASRLNDNGASYNACVQYNAYYDAKKSNEAIAQLYKQTSQQDKADLAKQKFENIQQKYEYGMAANEQKKTSINNQISLAEEKGRTAGNDYYKGLISAEQGNRKKLIAERNALQKSLDEALKSGAVKYLSDEWYRMIEVINEITNKIDESTLSIEEWNHAIRQNNWNAFDKSLETIKRFDSEAQFYVDFMEKNHDLFDSDTGDFTEYGNATLGLYDFEYKNQLAMAQQYADEYKELMAKIKRGEEDITDQNVIQRLRELQDAQRECKLSAEEWLSSIRSLLEQGYQSQLDALSKLIDKYKKLMTSEKNAYDYQKQIAEKTKNIATLQKQLTALGGDASEETKAKLQQLTVDLKEAQEDLEETQYDKYLSDTEDMLDTLQEDYEDFFHNRLKDTEAVIKDVTKAVNSMSGSIIATLMAQNGGISDELYDILKNGTTENELVEYMKKIQEKDIAAINNSDNSSDSVATLQKPSINNISETSPAKAQHSEEQTSLKEALKSDTSPATQNIISDDNSILIAEQGKSTDAMLTPGVGDKVFTSEMSDNLWEIAQNRLPVMPFTDIGVTMPAIPAMESNLSGGDVTVTFGDITLPNVTNYEEFKNELIKDKNFEKAVECMSIGKLSKGYNSMSKLKYGKK